MECHPNFKLKMMKLCCQGSQINIFPKSLFLPKTPQKLIKETSRSLILSFLERECAQTFCDASDCFHTLHKLQRMVKIKK